MGQAISFPPKTRRSGQFCTRGFCVTSARVNGIGINTFPPQHSCQGERVPAVAYSDGIRGLAPVSAIPFAGCPRGDAEFWGGRAAGCMESQGEEGPGACGVPYTHMRDHPVARASADTRLLCTPRFSNTVMAAL